ncbi:MAG: FAD-dependent oxidoreductase [Lentisphaeria bacterium]
MSEHHRFKIRSLEKLHSEIDSLGLSIPTSEDLEVLGDSIDIAGHPTPNRFVVLPMEGFDATPDGTPGPLAFRRYKRYAAGGSGLIWFEATAVVFEGRSNPGQFCIHNNNVETFKKLVAETRQTAREKHGTEPVLVLQITHSGRYSKPTGTPEPLIAHRSPILDPKHNLPEHYPVITDDYLDQLQNRFVEAAKLAAEAGFDGVDVKSCHRYLFSELLASFTRQGKYGGSFENRTRMLRETLTAIKEAVPEVFVTTRMNAYDAISYPYGFGVSRDDYKTPDLTEPLKLVGELQKIGIPVLNISIGNPYFNPHFGRPYDFPIKGMPPPEEYPLEGINRFINITGEIQNAYPQLPVIGSGYSWLRHFMPEVGAGIIKEGSATLIGQGRGAFAYPDSVRDILEKGAMDPAKCCVSCSACTQIMRDGGKTGCVVRDSDIYGPQYRLARRFALDYLIQEAERCRDCEEATCSKGCPAHIDIPAFINAFADQDYATAYQILKDNNVLPEMCGSVCPAGQQCEGECLEDIFCKNPIPIQDIQLVTARIARLKGLTGADVPEKATGRKIAVVGGGPGGVACAVKCLEKGHHVTIFEKGGKLGGTPDNTIPEERYRDSEAEIRAILKPAFEKDRVTVKTGVAFGTDFNTDDLEKEFDASFLAIGLTESTEFGDAGGAMSALEFLAKTKRGLLTNIPDKVAILGGGNTAMDAASEAKRLGARDVYVVYRRSFNEMPAWPQERNECLNRGVHFLLLMQPTGYETNDKGELTGIGVARTELGEPDESGRRRPKVLADSESILHADLAIEAIGQTVSEAVKQAMQNLPTNKSGLIELQPDSQYTGKNGFFAGGDIVNGGTTAVQGIVEGMRAAEEINEYVK